jgi:hypothetical protein
MHPVFVQGMKKIINVLLHFTIYLQLSSHSDFGFSFEMKSPVIKTNREGSASEEQ